MNKNEILELIEAFEKEDFEEYESRLAREARNIIAQSKILIESQHWELEGTKTQARTYQDAVVNLQDKQEGLINWLDERKNNTSFPLNSRMIYAGVLDFINSLNHKTGKSQ
jgi:hypothetical protein